ncbi:RluA family pseudouridine synthase [Oribacterium parvum]|uniref:RluA family pseudouridine synthase n=1 Tax=Oribacterium parvum TaxID=1501329 RepID=UPI0028DCD993|nr:RluA family pseudouridine synthase [Oribacterium parvum]
MKQNIRKLNYKITKSFHGLTIEAFLHRKRYTRGMISGLKKVKYVENGVTHYGIEKNGQWAFSIDSLAEGDLLSISFLEMEAEDSAAPYSLPLDIVYEDEDILLLNKPAGIPSHPSPGHYEGTLAGAASYYYKEIKGIQPFVCRMIHRLDLDTSGLLLLGKNKFSGSLLNQDMRAGRIERCYTAFCHGNPALAFENTTSPSSVSKENAKNSGNLGIPDSLPTSLKILPGLEKTGGILRISAPIQRVENEYMLREVHFPNGQEAVTNILSVEYFPKKDFSRIKLRLETGRTHQIRVHLSYIGCPLLGDRLYGGNAYTPYMKRQALHSSSIEFLHPESGEKMQFEIPLPRDMEELL